MYTRVRDDNDLDEATVRATVDAAVARLDARPVVPQGPPPAPVEVRPDAPRDAIHAAITADLLSRRVTPIFRGARSVAGLALRRHGPALIAVVYDRAPVAADGGVLTEADTALRSVAAKRVALDALEALTTP